MVQNRQAQAQEPKSRHEVYHPAEKCRAAGRRRQDQIQTVSAAILVLKEIPWIRLLRTVRELCPPPVNQVPGLDSPEAVPAMRKAFPVKVAVVRRTSIRHFESHSRQKATRLRVARRQGVVDRARGLLATADRAGISRAARLTRTWNNPANTVTIRKPANNWLHRSQPL